MSSDLNNFVGKLYYTAFSAPLTALLGLGIAAASVEDSSLSSSRYLFTLLLFTLISQTLLFVVF